jgi:cold shock CspA family protein
MATIRLASTPIDVVKRDADTVSQDRWTDDGGRVGNADPPLRAQAIGSLRGVIRQLKHLSAGTDIPATHLVAAHNGVGYGYINTPLGEVFFDASAVTNVRFDHLARGMTVEFTLDQAPYLRASRIVVVVPAGGQSGPDRESQEII